MEKDKVLSEEDLICWDCKKKLKKDEEVMTYDTGNKIFFKCKKCHKEDPMLRNFRETEVYSRVVGYIRPVKQWNPGKQVEFEDRVEFDIKE